VNLKAITVEELIERRKVRHTETCLSLHCTPFFRDETLTFVCPYKQILHLSMLKNLRYFYQEKILVKTRILKGLLLYREELEYGAQDIIETLKSHESKDDSIQWDKRVMERVKQEFDYLSREHRETEASKFNDDHKYRSLTTEAIELKSLALKKLEVFVQLYDANDRNQSILHEVIERPITDFAKESVIMELKTGIRGFPWTQVAEDSVSVDFGEWTPEGLDPSKVEKVVSVLTANDELRTVTVGTKKERLMLNDGWATAQLHWDALAAVQASASVVALLLRCCSSVSDLSLR
jgi:hypothetical protein